MSRKIDIYALACVAGGVYFTCFWLTLPGGPTQLLAAITVILVRVLTGKFGNHLPILLVAATEDGQ